MDSQGLEAFIEIPKGSSNKYEYDQQRGVFVLDRALFSPMYYPADYGFIPGTLAGDGDPLDVLVLVVNPTFPGCRIRCRPIGMFRMADEKGEDEKIIAVPAGDPRSAELQEVAELGPHLRREIEHFFSQYKQLEGKPVAVKGWADSSAAWQTIAEAKSRAVAAL